MITAKTRIHIARDRAEVSFCGISLFRDGDSRSYISMPGGKLHIEVMESVQCKECLDAFSMDAVRKADELVVIAKAARVRGGRIEG